MAITSHVNISVLLVVVCLGVFLTINFQSSLTSCVRESSSQVLGTEEEKTSSGSILDAIRNTPYQPSAVEQFVLDNGNGSLKLNGTTKATLADGCRIWSDETISPHYEALQQFHIELNQYNNLLQDFNGTIKDLRLNLDQDHKVCDMLELVPGGLPNIFRSGVLSQMGNGGGFVEPLLPPLRHPAVCNSRSNLMDMGYLIQDFQSLCRKLHRHSRTVFLDMGAALDFHGANTKGDKIQPAVYITHMYQKFGFHFDHIYAYELKEKDPAKVYSQIPNDLRAAYHWFNVGVSSDPESPNNPLTMLLENFNEDDFIVVKLDIDTGFIENPLARSILEDERFHELIDCFYFEHHVMLKELASSWQNSMEGSVIDSLKIFSGMREKGIASHYWP